MLESRDDVAVGDDENRVEDLFVGGVVEVREEVCGPGDGVRFTGASRVLDEVLPPAPAASTDRRSLRVASSWW